MTENTIPDLSETESETVGRSLHWNTILTSVCYVFDAGTDAIQSGEYATAETLYRVAGRMLHDMVARHPNAAAIRATREYRMMRSTAEERFHGAAARHAATL